jgi:hypothetical protein
MAIKKIASANPFQLQAKATGRSWTLMGMSEAYIISIDE